VLDKATGDPTIHLDEIAASHYSPQGLGTPVLANYSRDLRLAEWGFSPQVARQQF
jgi:hypothetical protein